MTHIKASDSIRIFGTVEDITTCDHCGRTDLKATVALSIDEGPVLHYGRDCAATALKVARSSISKAVRAADAAKEDEARQARRAAAALADAAWGAFLRPVHSNRFMAIERLGGFAAARAAFKAAQE